MTDRLPPHSMEAEQGVLGCILLDPVTALDECLRQIRAGPEVFYDLKHRTIYGVLEDMRSFEEPIDTVTVTERLKAAGMLDKVGGVSFLVSLPNYVPSAANLSFYLQMLLGKYALRRAIRACSEIVTQAYEPGVDVETLLGEAEQAVLGIRQECATVEEIDTKALVRQAIDIIESLHQNGRKIQGVSTGLTDLDRKTDGLHAGEMTVVSGYPGTGKTSMMLNLAEHALKEGVAVGVFSLEMPSVQLVMRFICSHARVNLRHIKGGVLTQCDFQGLSGAAASLAKGAIRFCDTSDITINQLRAEARRIKRKHDIRVWVVDYLQLVNGSGKCDNREQEVASVAKGLKAMAKETNAAVLVGSQLNDDGQIRESRAPGQHADNVWRLDLDKEDDQDRTLPVTLKILKQRNGPVGEVSLMFLREITRFENAAKIDREPTQTSTPYADS